MRKPLSEQLADLSAQAKSAEDAVAAEKKEADDKIAARREQVHGPTAALAAFDAVIARLDAEKTKHS